MNKKKPVFYAVLAAACYGISAPVSKALLEKISPALLAALLYLGAGLGMMLINAFRGKQAKEKEPKITPKEFPYIFAMIALDIAAPILLMVGLSTTSPAAASLLNSFEIVATATIALIIFKEAIGKRMWLAIALTTAASILLSVEDFSTLSFSPGSAFILLACVCWGLENNCTKVLSAKDPLQIVVIKGIGSGSGALLIAIFTGGFTIVPFAYAAAALLLGFAAFGLSIYFYLLAQRGLGAARTSAFYAFAPFIGVGFSFLLYREAPTPAFVLALAIMLLGAYFAAFEQHSHQHTHPPLLHEHMHRHNDLHHTHIHPSGDLSALEHSHLHQHAAICHKHEHMPDAHHTHSH